MYVRLDPHFFSPERPPQKLMEAVIIPGNFNWLEGFTLRKGMKSSAVYMLMDKSPKNDALEFWEYNVKGIRRLEIYVKKRANNYLTMMMEEIPKPDSRNGLMIGRCIHLDTLDPVGTPLEEVRVQHLDLAINVYEGDSRQKRFSETLKDGKTTDASFRTHLFRIEDAPFSSVFGFSLLFFKSRILLGDWFQEISRSLTRTKT